MERAPFRSATGREQWRPLIRLSVEFRLGDVRSDLRRSHRAAGTSGSWTASGADIGLRLPGLPAATPARSPDGRAAVNRVRGPGRPGIESGRCPYRSRCPRLACSRRERAMNIPGRAARQAGVVSAPRSRADARRATEVEPVRNRAPWQFLRIGRSCCCGWPSSRPRSGRQHGHLTADDPDHNSDRLLNGRGRPPAELPRPGDRLLGDRPASSSIAWTSATCFSSPTCFAAWRSWRSSSSTATWRC